MTEGDFSDELLNSGCWAVFVYTPVFVVVAISNFDAFGCHFVRLSWFFGELLFLRSRGERTEEAAG